MSASLSLRRLEEFDPHASGGGSGTASSSGIERRFLCPLCGEGKPRDAAHRSLGANTRSGAWLCHRCGEKGKLEEWWSERPPDAASPRDRVRRRLRQAFSLDALESFRPPPAISVASLPATPAQFAAMPHPAADSVESVSQPVAPSLRPSAWRQSLKNLRPLSGTPAASYLLRRGLADDMSQADVAHVAGVRFSPSWFGRPAVVFPIRDDRGTLVAAQGRYLGDGSGPKARTAGDKKAGVFVTAGLWEQVKRGAPVVICEAPIDALSLALCGYPALALCGKDGWPPWLAIRCAFKSVALALDADDAGEAGAAKLDAVLSSLGAQTFRLRPEGGKDWNQVLVEQGSEALTNWLAAHLLRR